MSEERRQQIIAWLEEGHDSHCPQVDDLNYECECGREAAEDLLHALDRATAALRAIEDGRAFDLEEAKTMARVVLT